MDKWVALNSSATGRDKLARLIQYACRTIWDSLESSDCGSFVVAEQFKTLEYILSSFRKLLRFGKCLDVFYASLKTIHYPELAVRVTLTMSKLSQALYLLADHMQWLARTGLFKSINLKRWATMANKYWLFAIVMNLCRDFYEIMRLIDLHKQGFRCGISSCDPLRARVSSSKELKRLALQSYTTIQAHKDVAVDTVKNICDFFIPFTALGYTNLSPRTIGLLGTISSAAGLLAIWDPRARLTPV